MPTTITQRSNLADLAPASSSRGTPPFWTFADLHNLLWELADYLDAAKLATNPDLDRRVAAALFAPNGTPARRDPSWTWALRDRLRLDGPACPTGRS
jgi:hypothetical protein